ASFTDLADVQVEGRLIRFQLSRPSVLGGLSLGRDLAIIPRHIFDPEGLLDPVTYKDIIGPKSKTDPRITRFAKHFNEHPGNRSPIGTGPYRFDRWESGRELILSRNDRYWGRQPYLDRIIFRFIPDAASALAALRAGELDLLPRLSPAQYALQTT